MKFKLIRYLILFSKCFVISLVLFGCAQQNESKKIDQYKYVESIDFSDETPNRGLESWVKEGADCYGIIMVRNTEKVPIRLIEVHAKIVSIRPEGIKMEALENVSVNRSIECNKITLKVGECWEEADGELFRTRREAIKFIDEKYPGLRVKHIQIAN